MHISRYSIANAATDMVSARFSAIAGSFPLGEEMATDRHSGNGHCAATGHERDGFPAKSGQAGSVRLLVLGVLVLTVLVLSVAMPGRCGHVERGVAVEEA